MSSALLFNNTDYFTVQEAQLKALTTELSSAAPAVFDDPAYVESIKRKYELRHLKLHPQSASEDVKEGASNTVIVHLAIPFSGEADLFRVRPTHYTYNPPNGQVTTTKGQPPGIDGSVVLTYQAHGTDAENYKRWRGTEEPKLQQWVDFINQDCDTFYNAMCQTIDRAIAERKARVSSLDAFKREIA